MNGRIKLMIPGPVEVHPDVLQAMASPLIAHYGDEWVRIYRETVELAKEVFETRGDLFVAVGSGTLGLEACLNSLSVLGGSVLIPTNGWFGEKLVTIAGCYTENLIEVRFPSDSLIPPEELRSILSNQRDIRAVAVVHSETHTGVLNPVRDYGEICREYDVMLMVDGVSSVGATPLEMDDAGIDLCVTASQKALAAPPGLSLVAVSNRCWQALSNSQKDTGWYVNLKVWRKVATEWADWHPSISTMAVPAFLALRRSLQLIHDEGLQARFQRHRRISLLVRQGLRDLGVTPFVPDEIASPSVTSALLPEGYDSAAARRHLLERHNIMIAGARIPGAERAIRIGHMGPQAEEQNIVEVLSSIKDYLTAAETH